MLKALAVTFIIFAILFSGIIALKRSANHWKVPKGVKPQPYENDDKKNEDDSNKDYDKETPQLTDQSKTANNEQNTETKNKE